MPKSLTSRMVALLAACRRERNGLVADTMYYDGARYGLNYGVALPTLRRLVREESSDHDFARFLYGQDVRELQLAALHLADPARLNNPDERDFWLSGVRNSELAEEAAFALLCRVEGLAAWMASETLLPLQRYALWMAAARAPYPVLIALPSTLDTLRRVADDVEAPAYALRLLLRGVIALWVHLAAQTPETHRAVAAQLHALGTASWEQELRDELAWRLPE